MTKKIDVTLSERELFISAVDGIVQSSCARQIIIKERTEKEEKKNFVYTFAYWKLCITCMHICGRMLLDSSIACLVYIHTLRSATCVAIFEMFVCECAFGDCTLIS